MEARSEAKSSYLRMGVCVVHYPCGKFFANHEVIREAVNAF